jgi:CBS domain-containing protein
VGAKTHNDPLHHRVGAAYQQNEQNQQAPQAAVFAGQIMTSPAFSIAQDASIDEAWTLFEQQHLHHLPVVNKKQLVGILSDRDLLRFAVSNSRDKKLGNYPVARIMQPRVFSAQADTEIRAIAEVMTRHRFNAMPIINEKSEVVGVVTRADILRSLVKQANLELWA